MTALVEIVAYDASWPRKFEQERQHLEQVLAHWLAGSIEHIGSTAVAGLAAKPVIDIMAAVADLPTSRPAIDALARAGYLYSPYKPEVMHWFCKPSSEVRTHHLHLVPATSTLWNERLAFRDALRSSASLRNEYVELKFRLALQYQEDREAYTEGKTDFVRRVLAA